MRKAIFLPALAVTMAWPVLAAPGEPTIFEAPLGKLRTVRLDADLGAGRFDVYPDAPRGKLYRAEVEHDPELAPSADLAGGTLSLGVKGPRFGPGNRRHEWDLHLSDRPTWDLNFDLGATRAYLELSGLKVRELDLQAGAAQVTVAWERPNRVSLERAHIQGGASRIALEGLGYAGIRELECEGGAASFALDFTGPHRGRARVVIQTGAGSVEVKVPKAIGIRVLRQDAMLARVSLPGDVGAGEKPESANYQKARGKVDLDVRATIGRVRVMRI